METSTEKQADGRWIFPKELEGIYSNEQLKYFIDEAEIKLQETVSGLTTARERYYSIINIMLVIIGALSTILFTCNDLGQVKTIFLTGFLAYFFILCSLAFLRLKYYSQCGPGTKPREGLSKGSMEWMKYYHGEASETNILYTILEGKQGCIDFNNKVCEKQLAFLWKIQFSIFCGMLAITAFLIVAAIWF